MPVHDWTRVIPGIFHDFHHEWISSLKHYLNDELLPADYYALAEQITGDLGPDVLALGVSDSEFGSDLGVHSSDLTAGLITAPPKTRFTAHTEVETYAQRRSRIAIHHRSGDRVLAVIEILSPGNKSSRYALRNFVEKAIQLMTAGIHLLIVDLFPPTSRDPQGIHGAIWGEFQEDLAGFSLPAAEPLLAVAYTGGLERQAFIEPFAVGQLLPEMPLFLQPPGYVTLPLEITYNAAFARVPRRWQRELASPPELPPGSYRGS